MYTYSVHTHQLDLIIGLAAAANTVHLESHYSSGII